MKAALLAIFVCFALMVSFGCLQPSGQNTPGGSWNGPSDVNSFVTLTGHVDPTAYNSSSDTTKGISGNITTATFTNQNSGSDATFYLLNDAGATVWSKLLAAGSNAYNNTLGNATYNNVTVQVYNNYTTGGSYPNAYRQSWWRMDEGSGNTTADQNSTNTLELGTNATNWPGWNVGAVYNGTQYNGSSWARVNNSANLNISGISNNTFTASLWALINGSNSNAYLIHQGPLGKSNGSFALQLSYDSSTATSSVTASANRIVANITTNSTAVTNISGSMAVNPANPLNSSIYNATLEVNYTVGNQNLTSTNTTSLTNANGTRNLFLNSSFRSNSDTNATLTVNHVVGTYVLTVSNASGITNANTSGNLSLDQDLIANSSYNATITVHYAFNDTNTSVSVNGYVVGNLSNSSPNSFSFSQGNLTSHTQIYFVSDKLGTNITNLSVSYSVIPSVNVSVNGYNLGILSNTSQDTFNFSQVNLSTSTAINFTPRYNGQTITNISLAYGICIIPNVTWNGINFGQLDGTSPDDFALNNSQVSSTNTLGITAPATGNTISSADLYYTEVYQVRAPYTLASGATFSDTVWHNFIVAYNDTNLSLYVDGALANYTSYSPVTAQPSNSSFYLGDSTGSTYFTGRLDELQFWNTTLNPTQAAYVAGQKFGVHGTYSILIKR